MKIKFPLITTNTIWKNNKPFIVFISILLFIYSLLKIIFYNYNYQIIFNNKQENINNGISLSVVQWSILYDLLIILLVNVPLLFILQLSRWKFNKIISYVILSIFILLNSLVILLNVTDIFYFRFHFQRADADLFDVLDYPLQRLFSLNFFVIVAIFLAIAGTIILITKLCKNLHNSFKNGDRCNAVTLFFITLLILIPFYKNYFNRLLVPTFPLINLNSKQLIVVQNSFHTFVYAVFRKNSDADIKNYMSIEKAQHELPIKKMLQINLKDTAQKNIVLFIMESVPFEFFDSSSEYKVEMPFFDSIIKKSTFFNNAFSYALESNKGITAVLAGTPTLTNIPLYHSTFTNMPITGLGTELKKNNYHSFFCIGDDYNNFGFAECINWLGINKYYCKNDMGKFKSLSAQTMGLQDEDVLNFMNNKIDETQQPFFAVNYNISTHFPYDIPKYYKNKHSNYSGAMKSMSYYDHSLNLFFNNAKNKPWFKNTVFIFCPDHWMYPDYEKPGFNAINSHKIPIIIYDPSIDKKKTNSLLVSQFDILGTILSIGKCRDSIFSYGGNLLDSTSISEVAFCKINDGLYQVIDTAYVLGFNTGINKPEYLYHYKTDKNLKVNLLQTQSTGAVVSRLSIKIKAFLQNATRQYHGLLR